MNIGDKILNEIIKQDMVRADTENPSVLVWNSNAEEQLDALISHALQPDTSQTLWAVKSPTGELNHTTIACREDYAIKEWMHQEQMVTRTLCGHPVPSWEGYEAQGYSCVKCFLVERPA